MFLLNWQVIVAQRAPGGPVSYYKEMIEKLIKEQQESLNISEDHPEIEDLARDVDIDELTRYWS